MDWPKSTPEVLKARNRKPRLFRAFSARSRYSLIFLGRWPRAFTLRALDAVTASGSALLYNAAALPSFPRRERFPPMACDAEFLTQIRMFDHLSEDDRLALASVIDETTF